MNKYPYYIPVRIESGIMHKIFNNKKFKTHNEAVDAMTKRYANLAEITAYNSFLDTQNVILEYISEYQGQIVSIYTNGEYTMVKIPVNLI